MRGEVNASTCCQAGGLWRGCDVSPPFVVVMVDYANERDAVTIRGVTHGYDGTVLMAGGIWDNSFSNELTTTNCSFFCCFTFLSLRHTICHKSKDIEVNTSHG